MQQALLLVNAQLLCENLWCVLEKSPKVFLAAWCRDRLAVAQLTKRVPDADLPPKYERTRLRKRRQCFLLVLDVFYELERLFELIGGIRQTREARVTWKTVTDALNSGSSLTSMICANDNTKEFLHGTVAHLRSIHGTMNRNEPMGSGDPVHVTVEHALKSSPLSGKTARRVRQIDNEVPARFFLGLGTTNMAAVGIIQIGQSVGEMDPGLLPDGKATQTGFTNKHSTRVMSLAVIITSNICMASAKTMMSDKRSARDVAGANFNEKLYSLICNPLMVEKCEREIEKRSAPGKKPKDDASLWRTVVGSDHETFKSSYQAAYDLAKQCSAGVGLPGWSMGFRFEAWGRPCAEVKFLNLMLEATAPKDNGLEAEQRLNKLIRAVDPLMGPRKSIVDYNTGWPKFNPQWLIGRKFEAELSSLYLRNCTSKQQKLRRKLIMREVAETLPTLTAITDDPTLLERYKVDQDTPELHVARIVWKIR
jgi:hypothetical protein